MPSSNNYKNSDEEFIKAVKNSTSIAEVLRKLQLSIYGSSYKSFTIRAKTLNLDTSHFIGQGYLKNKNHSWSIKIPLDEILIENSKRILSSSFKKRILKEGLLEEKCIKCQMTDTWNGEPITLQIDHINGNPFDHRIENLRILCPNCHSQTSNFGSKNKSGRSSKKNKLTRKILNKSHCNICGVCTSYNYKYCGKCYRDNRKELQTPYERKKKIEWPSIEELLKLLENSNYSQVALKLNVSDNAIRKHIKMYRQVA